MRRPVKQESLDVITLLAVCLTLSVSSSAQDSAAVKEYVKNTFDHTQLFNCQTVEVLPKRSYMFRIQHRFGAVGLNESFYKQFLGLDLPANIRLGFAMAVTKRLLDRKSVV